MPDNTTDTLRFITDIKGHWNGRIKMTFDCLRKHGLAHATLNGALLKVGKFTFTAELSHSFIVNSLAAGTNRPAKRNNVYSNSNTTLLKCATAINDPEADCDEFPCPICDAPGGVRFKRAEAEQ